MKGFHSSYICSCLLPVDVIAFFITILDEANTLYSVIVILRMFFINSVGCERSCVCGSKQRSYKFMALEVQIVYVCMLIHLILWEYLRLNVHIMSGIFTSQTRLNLTNKHA